MKKIDPKLSAALDEAGAVLVRETKHLIFQIPGVQRPMVVSQSPSDVRATRNNLAILRRLLRSKEA